MLANFSGSVMDSGGRTVVVQPLWQIVEPIVDCVTAGLSAPGVQLEDGLERQAAQRETSIATLQEELRESHRAKAAVDATLSMREAAIAARDAQLAAQGAELDARNREIDRRRGWRWWLKLPFIRLGLLGDRPPFPRR